MRLHEPKLQAPSRPSGYPAPLSSSCPHSEQTNFIVKMCIFISLFSLCNSNISVRFIVGWWPLSIWVAEFAGILPTLQIMQVWNLFKRDIISHISCHSRGLFSSTSLIENAASPLIFYQRSIKWPAFQLFQSSEFFVLNQPSSSFVDTWFVILPISICFL